MDKVNYLPRLGPRIDITRGESLMEETEEAEGEKREKFTDPWSDAKPADVSALAVPGLFDDYPEFEEEIEKLRGHKEEAKP